MTHVSFSASKHYGLPASATTREKLALEATHETDVQADCGGYGV